MAGESKPTAPHSTKPRSASATLNAFSRVTASVGLLVLFGFGGSWLDRWLGTSFLTISGFVLGGVIMLVGMLYAVKAAEFERKKLKELEVSESVPKQ